jgi:hypothetical protein
MKAITIWQPYASLIILGEKRYETRSWKATHRGTLAIHAGVKDNMALRILCGQEPFKSILAAHGIPDFDALPRGCVLGTVTLEDCIITDLLPPDALTECEQSFGDFSPGRYAWRLSNPTPLVVPQKVMGGRSIFVLPDLLCLNPGESPGSE